MSKKMKKDILIVGFSMFAIFFGSGNLIFPPQIGLLSGSDIIPAVIGLGLSGILFPMLAVAAVGNTGYSLKDMTKHVNPWWHHFYMGMGLVVVLFGTIPRCGGVAFESGLQGITGPLPVVARWGFLAVFFLIAFLFASSRSGFVDKIGNYLTPFLLVSLLIIIVLAFVNPIDSIKEGSIDNAFTNAFLTGYNTGDVGTGIICATIFIAVFQSKGYTEDKKTYKTMMTGIIIIGFILLFIVYAGLAYLGAQATDIYPTDMDQTILLTSLVERLAGYGGLVILAIAIILACLTTAAGMIGTTAGWITDWTSGKVNYKLAAGIIAFAIFLVASAGVANVLAFSGPIFILLFPMSVVMMVLGLFKKLVPNDGAWKGAVYMAFIMSVFDALNAWVAGGFINIDMSGINKIISYIPLADAGFTWLVPSIVGFIVGAIIFKALGKKSLEYDV